MIGLAFRLFGLIASPFNGAVKWCVTHPMTCLCAILACYGLYERHRAAGWQDYAHKLEAASSANARATAELRAKERQDYERQANDAQSKYMAALDSVRAPTDRFIMSNRMRASGVSPAQPISSTGDPGVHEALSAHPFVAVTDADVQTCSADAAYAVGAYNFGVTITAPVVP